jgi:thiamine-phosphate diphosphorylase
MTPVMCFISDRRRVAGGSERALIEQIAAAARGGVHLIQIRERDLEARALTQLAAAAVGAVRGTRARILVNDRADVALAAGAHGVHLRGDSVPAGRVREIVPAGFLIGRSVHGVDEARQATASGGLDYLIFGTVFETESKAGVIPAGADGLRSVAAVTPLPVLGVGGVTIGRLTEVAQARAAGFAAIGLFAQCPADRLQVVVGQASLAFDTLPRVP